MIFLIFKMGLIKLLAQPVSILRSFYSSFCFYFYSHLFLKLYIFEIVIFYFTLPWSNQTIFLLVVKSIRFKVLMKLFSLQQPLLVTIVREKNSLTKIMQLSIQSIPEKMESNRWGILKKSCHEGISHCNDVDHSNSVKTNQRFFLIFTAICRIPEWMLLIF